MGRNAEFNADIPETPSGTLRKLGYSEEEIGATAHALPSTMGYEDKIRTSLRALSAEHSHTVQVDAQARTPDFTPKNPTKAVTPDETPDYWQGRRDEAEVHKEDRQQNPKPKAPPRARAARQQAPGAKEYKTAKNLAKIARLMNGKKR